MRLLSCLTLVFLLSNLSGCHRTPAFQGKWEFDRAYTESRLPKEERSPTATPPLFSPAMIVRTLEGSTLTIASQEIIGKGGTDGGKSSTYEVDGHPQKDLWRIKHPDGTTDDLILEDGRLVFHSSGGAPFKVYYKRASS